MLFLELPLIVFGSPGQARVPKGAPTGGEWTKGGANPSKASSSAKSERAKAAHKGGSLAAQRHGEANEPVVAAMFGGSVSGDNKAFDVTTSLGGHAHGVEVKTMTENGNNKITMNRAAVARKNAWARSNHARIHTVVVDDRRFLQTHDAADRLIYYKRGVGSFRVSSMTLVHDSTHLKSLMTKR